MQTEKNATLAPPSGAERRLAMKSFQDRRAELFGRERDIHYLVDRARKRGVTAVVARPLMGKTWTFEEVARRLTEEGKFLVGYHESTGTESNHLLYAVSNLYTRWLDDASMREQAISLWAQHKENLLPNVGKMVSTLFSKLGGVTAGVGAIVSAGMNSLAEAQQDLLTGGMQLRKLEYEEALELTNLVAKITNRHIVLILDAWEKAPSMRSDSLIFEHFIKHQHAWPDTHFLLAIRNPDLDSTTLNEEAFKRARDLRKLSPAIVSIHDLPPISLDETKECARAVDYLHRKIPITENVDDQELLEMIAGFPGVLDFWKKGNDEAPLRTKEDLGQSADDAQLLRYPEFDHLIPALSDEQRTMAARLAFFPRLDGDKWEIFKEMLLKGISETTFDTLVDSKVLEDERFPSYGHDTRHVAARRWFVENENNLPLIRRVGEALVEALAARITKADRVNRPFFETLSACFESAQLVGVHLTSLCLIDAAKSAVNDSTGIFHPSFDDTCQKVLQRNALYTPLIAYALVNRGYFKNERGETDGAIADWTKAITLPNAPVEQVAISFFNRGILKGKRGDIEGEIADYTTAIELPNAPADAIADAHTNRGLAREKLGDVEGEIDDYTAAMNLLSVGNERISDLLINRGDAKRRLGDIDGEIADFTAVIKLQNVHPETLANALYGRGIAQSKQGNVECEISDFTNVIELPDAPVELVANALYRRGLATIKHGNLNSAINDFTAVIELPNAPVEAKALALYNRGVAKSHNGNVDEAMADWTSTIALPDAPISSVSMALNNRGALKHRHRDVVGAIADYSTVIEFPDAPEEQLAIAFHNRGIVKDQCNDFVGAIADFSAVVESPNVPVALIASNSYVKGLARAKRGNLEAAIGDFTSVIEMTGAPIERVSMALMDRGVANGKRGNTDEAIEDFTKVIDLNIQAEIVAKALHNRGTARGKSGDISGAIADFNAVIGTPDAPTNVVESAREILSGIIQSPP